MPSTADSVPTDDTIEGESMPGDESIPSDPSEACYRDADPADAASCFEEVVASGAIEASSVPLFLRFPECGLAELGWSGDYYSLPDAEFAATVTEAAPCFQAHVAAGDLEDYELSVELTHPECLDGRNWYSTTDEAYLDAFAECAFG